MMDVTRIVVFAVLFCVWAGTSAQDADIETCERYGFGEEQEKQWAECAPACDGEHQSPINIEVSEVVTEDLPSADGSFYQERNVSFKFNITNVNYTVTVQLLDADYLFLEGGPLQGRYFLHDLQFCWGSDDSMGSDHTINNTRYPLESQWGLYSERYANYEEASRQPGGTLKISQLYPIQENSNPSLAPIVRALPSVVQPGQSTTSEEPLTYDGIFSGYSVDDYFHYNGSFITPPCTETVLWFVFPPLNGVSEEQVAEFRNLQSTDGPLVNNFRQTQPLNGRRVIRSNKGSLASARRRSGSRHQATVVGRHGRHGASRHHASARRHHQ